MSDGHYVLCGFMLDGSISDYKAWKLLSYKIWVVAYALVRTEKIKVIKSYKWCWMPAKKEGGNVVSLKVMFYCSTADMITQSFVGQIVLRSQTQLITFWLAGYCVSTMRWPFHFLFFTLNKHSLMLFKYWHKHVTILATLFSFFPDFLHPNISAEHVYRTVCLLIQRHTTAAVFDESHLPAQRRNRLFLHTRRDTVGEQCHLCQSLITRGEEEEVKTCFVFGPDEELLWSVWGWCNLKRSSTFAADYNFQRWTYNLIGWGGAGDVALDLSSLPSDGILDWITGDDGGTWNTET